MDATLIRTASSHAGADAWIQSALSGSSNREGSFHPCLTRWPEIRLSLAVSDKTASPAGEPFFPPPAEPGGIQNGGLMNWRELGAEYAW